MPNHADITVVVAMSGGVDSSVAAALLVEQGYNVIGMMMRLWSEESFDGKQHNRCCTPEQMSDAQTVASRLGIPFYVLDTKATFRNTVVQYFIDQHAAGLTPNPCIECNRQIRFSFLQQNALAMDADYLATGHYARITQDENGRYQLRKGLDPTKDQSYVLSVMGQPELAHAMFPVGTYEKTEIRKIAEKIGLTMVHAKKDSQDLCFLGDGDYRRFLREHAPNLIQPGEIRLASGESIGQHNGLVNYTIGQRKGIGVAHAEPLYVIGKDSAQNVLIVGQETDLGRRSLTAKRVNWVSGQAPTAAFEADVKIRYKANPMPAWITPLEGGRIAVEFAEPLRDITPGQGAILYHADLCLGGGIIEAD